jgi:hypothetical protein
MAAITVRRGLRWPRGPGAVAKPAPHFGRYAQLRAPTLPLGAAGAVPPHIVRPPYAVTGQPPPDDPRGPVPIHPPATVTRLRAAGQLVRAVLDHAQTLVSVRALLRPLFCA